VITEVHEERLAVVSDVHLGNPLYRARRPFVEFLKFALTHETPVVLNGDAVDILQASVGRLTRELSDCAVYFAKFAQRNLRIYYTLGNHDIALEHFLNDWGIVCCTPFLDVTSGGRRIRIEHGHVYDEMFVHYPRTFGVMTILGGAALRVHPTVYHAFKGFNAALRRLGEWVWSSDVQASEEADIGSLARQIPGEQPAYLRAARELTMRGYDAVIFGHTHRPGTIDLGDGCLYVNTGSWDVDPHVAQIDHGDVHLHKVFGGAIAGEWSKKRGSWMMVKSDLGL
jgi:UDP-2,3-diacylglucosamine pyrophosphatase LpxH